LNKIEGTLVYGPKCLKTFEDTIKVLIPNWGDFAPSITTILKNIVSHLVSHQYRDTFLQSHRQTWLCLYKKDSAVFAGCFNRIQRRRLTEAGKKAVASKKKPQPQHYENYTALVKPSIETQKVPISTSELTVLKAVNKELQSLDENLHLKANLDQARRREEASHIIQLLHTKCKRIDNLVASRKQRAHKELITLDRDGKIKVPTDTMGNKLGFTTEQWRDVITPIIESDKSVIEALQKEFCCNQTGKIRWSDLSAKI
jgi:hypothetical protein